MEIVSKFGHAIRPNRVHSYLVILRLPDELILLWYFRFFIVLNSGCAVFAIEIKLSKLSFVTNYHITPANQKRINFLSGRQLCNSARANRLSATSTTATTATALPTATAGSIIGCRISTSFRPISGRWGIQI